MSEPVLRLLIVAVVVLVVAVVAIVARRGASFRRRAPLAGLAPGLYVFVSDTCATCERVEQLVSAVAGADHHRLSWEQEPDRFRELGVERVPLTVLVAPDGGGWAAAGVPSPRRLRRWLGDP